jgi:hypothetical protein
LCVGEIPWRILLGEDLYSCVVWIDALPVYYGGERDGDRAVIDEDGVCAVFRVVAAGLGLGFYVRLGPVCILACPGDEVGAVIAEAVDVFLAEAVAVPGRVCCVPFVRIGVVDPGTCPARRVRLVERLFTLTIRLYCPCGIRIICLTSRLRFCREFHGQCGFDGP